MSNIARRSVFRWLALPWWAAQVLSGAKSFRDHPLIGSRRLNRLGLHRWRVRAAHWLAARRRARLASTLSAEDRAQFAQQGYVLVRDVLPADAFAALREAIVKRVSPAREMVQGDAITRRIAIDAAMLRDIPALRHLIRMPRWAALMRYVASFDCEPLYYIQTILTHRVDAPPDPQLNLHADTFHPTMKAFYFLTDVHEEDGPFTYVDGSHRLTTDGWRGSTAARCLRRRVWISFPPADRCGSSRRSCRYWACHWRGALPCPPIRWWWRTPAVFMRAAELRGPQCVSRYGPIAAAIRLFPGPASIF